MVLVVGIQNNLMETNEKTMKIKLFNGRLITPWRDLGPGFVLIEDGKITDIGSGDVDTPEHLAIDALGGYIAPGFIDIHTHGAGGHDFMDGTREAFLGAARTHAEHGTTLLYPTTLTSTNASPREPNS